MVFFLVVFVRGYPLLFFLWTRTVDRRKLVSLMYWIPPLSFVLFLWIRWYFSRLVAFFPWVTALSLPLGSFPVHLYTYRNWSFY